MMDRKLDQNEEEDCEGDLLLTLVSALSPESCPLASTPYDESATMDSDSDDVVAAFGSSLLSPDSIPAAISLYVGGGSAGDSPPNTCGQHADASTHDVGVAQGEAKSVRRRLYSSAHVANQSLGSGVANWPVEVTLCVARYIAWHQFVRNCSRLSRSWRNLEREDSLWRVYFQSTWPRLARRRGVSSESVLAWRSMFRNRWSEPNRLEDALEEDWLDFYVARDCKTEADDAMRSAGNTADMTRVFQVQLETALQQLRDDLKAHGVVVPVEPDRQHTCSKACRFHQLLEQQDAFVCEESGLTHCCDFTEPCDICVLSGDDHYLVCPASGRCFERVVDASEEAWNDRRDAGQASLDAAVNDWDPGLSAMQQFGRWFEQGYSMSEEQAQDFFEGEVQAHTSTRGAASAARATGKQGAACRNCVG